uniref:non-specific serine/threonine protein kinase n=1 Tax=Davidia involucrata TaxID=16924 RepID=A0A5B6YZJ2_DAVIN
MANDGEAAQSPEQSGSSDSPSPPPPSSNNSSSSPPPSSSSSPPPKSSASPPPPKDSDSPSPPPPKDSDSPSPPPPKDSDSSSPPPPKDSGSPSPPPPPKNSGSPSPKSSPSPPPPPPSSSSNNNNNNNNNNKSPPPPPPPPVSRNSPPPPPRHSPPLSSSSNSSRSSSSDTSSNSKIIVAGVVAGAGLLLIVMIVFLVSCTKKKKRKPHGQMQYYNDHSNGRSDYYNNTGQHGNWTNNGQYTNHIVKMPSGPPGANSAEYGNWAAPPPPPPMMNSSDMSSNFSGPHQPALPPPPPSMSLGFNTSNFTYDNLAAATGGFAKANLLGQGGFGYVHKGVLPDGREVAVKSLKSGSGQGEREFQAEVDIISRVHHRHLVSLVGYCIAGSQRMLVYEFVPNSTLEFHLHGKDRPTMDWPTRLKIALGSAKGFAYLHEDCHPRIIHRDIKAANILIDYQFEAKVADFGLAKLSSDNYTHVSTRIMGTFGYLAPEYASSGKLTEKSDVYSYGVMILELITGRRPVDVYSDDDSLVDWARPILTRVTEGGSYEELVDPRLEDNYDPQEMLRLVASAGACIRHSARRRPKMSQVVRALEGDVSLEDLNEGVKPGHSSVFGSNSSPDYDGSSYSTDMKKFRKMALSSQEFTSSEHGQTGEFSVRPSSSSGGGESREMRKLSP